MASGPISLAVLIDAENARASQAAALFEAVAKIGTAQVRRLYGDFTNPCLQPWQEPMVEYSIQPVQTCTGIKGKNAADIALVIDALDLLHTKRPDGFCLVSSDSDFTRLASRIREDGIPVYGFGAATAPKAFARACSDFFWLEELAKGAAPPHQLPAGSAPIEQLSAAVQEAANGSDWADLARVSSAIRRLVPDFDQRQYGHAKFRALLESLSFEIQRRGPGASPALLYVRAKPTATSPSASPAPAG